MGMENGKWRVVRGDCLWNIARSVYSDPYRWKDIANANGISQSTALIYPGQLLTLPNISSGSSSAPTQSPVYRPDIVWFTLTAGSEREMQAVWRYDASNYFLIRWEQWDSNGHLWMVEEKTVNFNGQQKASLGSLKDTAGWNVCRFSVRPVDKDGNNLANTDWAYKEYDFRNNPPQLPPSPSIDIDINNKLTVTLENIDEDINADSIEIAIYQDNTTKYSTAKVSINSEARFASYTCTVDAGYEYKVRCRAVRGTIYGGWTDYTSNVQSLPVAPTEITTLRAQTISEQMSKKYGVFIEWNEVKTAKTYNVQYVTNTQYFDDPSKITTASTTEGEGPRLLLSDLEVGHEYFFRVQSVNDKGVSRDYSSIKSVIIGTKPSAPTTWSNTSSAVIGEDLNLYWNHNSSDNSIETYARLNLKITDSLNPTKEPMEYTKVIQNTKPEEDQNKTSVYTINTSDPEWALVKAGFIIKWKVQTAGVASEYSDWSVEREVNVYAKPELELDITNQNGGSISEVNTYPFHFSVLAKPSTQVPLSYYLEVVANEGYETVDNVGNVVTVNPGDKVYQKYYDPDTNAWRFIAVMTPANIDLKNDINYTVNCTVSMNSGLTATDSQSFDVYFNDSFYDVSADIVVNNETLEASIHPYCNEFYEDDSEPGGKNWLRLTTETKQVTQNGVSISIDENGFITLNGTATGDSWADFIWDLRYNTVNHTDCKYDFKNSTTVTSSLKYLSGTISTGQLFVGLVGNDDSSKDLGLTYPNGLTSTKNRVNGVNRGWISLTKGTTYNNFKFGLQIEEGSTATDYETYKAAIKPRLVENCTLSVYRREYDGTFTEIATGINNEPNLYVTDPHPSLDYARYRAVAKTNDTGAISYSDIPATKVGEPCVIIQWAEKWSSFESGEDGEGSVEPAWSGSMLKIPYNIDISESNSSDVSLVEYIGRQRPVSYYGTQLGESSNWNVEIPSEDKETLYNIRRLQKWMGDVYVREPSGIGYWANISVSYNKTHNSVTIPVTFNIKRVEGGM